MSDLEDMRVAKWAFDSHLWKEKYPGDRYICKLCNRAHTSTMVIDKDYPLCPENYAVKRSLKESGGKS